MPMTLELPDDLVEILGAEAARRGLSLHDYTLQILTPPKPSVPSFKDGATLLAHLEAEGLLGTRTDITDTLAEARRLREMSNNRAGEL